MATSVSVELAVLVCAAGSFCRWLFPGSGLLAPTGFGLATNFGAGLLAFGANGTAFGAVGLGTG